MSEFKCNDTIKIVIPKDDWNYPSKYNGMKGIFIKDMTDEFSVIKIEDEITEPRIIESIYLKLSDEKIELSEEEKRANRNLSACIRYTHGLCKVDVKNLKEKDEDKMQNKINIGDRVKINFPKDSRMEQSIYNGKIGVCVAINRKLDVKVDGDYIILPEKYVTLYERAQEEELNTIPDDKIRIFKEDKEGENFVTKLQNSLGLHDEEKFLIDKDNRMCYFKEGNFFLVDPDTHENIKNDALRGEIFYGLANGNTSPLKSNNPFPSYASPYYYWSTNLLSSIETVDIASTYWKNRLEDYSRFLIGNCFATAEACKNNADIIKIIKNRSMMKQYGK